MNLLFLTLIDFNTIQEFGIYQDLLREFSNHNHKVYIISPVERRKKQNTHLIEDRNTIILKLKIGNIQKTNVIEKGISTIFIESIIIKGIKKFFTNVKFDLIMYSTPPITFCNAIKFVKKRDSSKTYLLLKDIFPQNAVDIGMISTVGVKGLIYKFFRIKEKRLYAISDHIGCMSKANVEYVIRNNPEIAPEIVEICPNSIKVIDRSIDEKVRVNIRQKYKIPLDKMVFIYGGNLGKPQGIDFLIKCLYGQRKNEKVFFLIIGDGTEYRKLECFLKKYPQNNIKLVKQLPKEDYDKIVAACDVGMIFLDYRFTIPNFPSRLLGYMQAKIPVLACTDPHTDIGKVIVDGGFGWWCESNDEENFKKIIKEILNSNLTGMKIKEFQYLEDNYNVAYEYYKIMRWFKEQYD